MFLLNTGSQKQISKNIRIFYEIHSNSNFEKKQQKG